MDTQSFTGELQNLNVHLPVLLPRWRLYLRRKFKHVPPVSSGLAALWAALVHFNPHRVAMDGGYHGSVQAIKLYSQKYGTEVVGLQDTLSPGDMMWLETPKNPTCEVSDVQSFASKCTDAGAFLCVDATFAPPPLQVWLPYSISPPSV